MSGAEPPREAPPLRLPVRPQWLALRSEEALEPALPIVDAHHHLWDTPTSRYLLPELLADLASGHNVVATVFMQSHAMYRAHGDPALRAVGETEFANGVAAMAASGTYGNCRVCAGIVGDADLMLGAPVARVLDAHVAAGGGRFRGVRRLVQFHPDPTARGMGNFAPRLLLEPAFRAGFACLAPRGLSFDAWVYHTQLADVADLAGAFPDTTIVLNHVGGAIGIGPYSGRRDAVFREWEASIRTLARHANVHVKLGGMGMRIFGFGFEDAPLPPSSEALAQAWAPYLDACVSAFGPGRCMFEGNMPVDKGTCSYGILWNAFKRFAQRFSADERSELFSGTANRVYRLALAASETQPA